MADLRFTVDYSQVKEANKEILKVGSNAQKSASVFEAAFKKAEIQAGKSALAVREQIAFSERLERQKTREANATAAAAAKVAAEEKRVAQAARENTNALNRMRAAYDSSFAVEQRTLDLKRRLRQEIANGTMTVRQAGAELLKYRAHMQQFNIAQMAATKSNNRMGVVTQQAGYQIGDFLVQVQGGTNFLVAFGQQATQLVGVLPLIAAQLGLTTAAAIGLSTALGIGIPLVTAIGAALMRTRENAKQAAAGVGTLQEAMESLKSSSVSLEVELAKMSFGTESSAIAKGLIQRFQLTMDLVAAEREYAEALENSNENEFSLRASGQAGRAAQRLQELNDQLRLLDEELNKNKELEAEEAKRRTEQERNESVVRQLVQARIILREQEAAAIKEATDRLNEMVSAEARLNEMRFEFSAGGQALSRYGGRGTVSDQAPIFGDTGLPIRPVVTGGGRGSSATTRDPVADFEKQLALEEELLGKTEARRRVIQALGVDFVRNNQAAVANYEAQIEAITEATRLEKEREALLSSVENSMTSGFMAMVDGTKSVKDAFKSMARDIIAELYKVLVVQQIVNSAKTAMGGFFADGAAFSGGRVTPFANGGVVGGPTYFPMAGGKTGLMGEAGPEAIMPLKRGSDGKLGVSVEGGSGSVNVTNNINVTGGSDPAAIRMEVAKLMPQITNATKSAVIDARRRGGQMKAAFG